MSWLDDGSLPHTTSGSPDRTPRQDGPGTGVAVGLARLAFRRAGLPEAILSYDPQVGARLGWKNDGQWQLGGAVPGARVAHNYFGENVS